MIRLFYTRWGITASNHAGFAYLCDYLAHNYPNEFEVAHCQFKQIKEFDSRAIPPRIINYFIRKFNTIYKKSQLKHLNKCGVKTITWNNNDVALLTEYLINGEANQKVIADILPTNIKKFAFAHLVIHEIEEKFNTRSLLEWARKVDKIIVLGSSLAEYLVSKGVPNGKIATTFHYVDQYYLNPPATYNEKRLKVLAQGNHMRDLDTLDYVVNHCQNIDFIICQGHFNLESRYTQPNVTLKSYMPEEELKQLMTQCPVSLNCMLDTIGSNVIVTSMGMGEAMVCSDVGSIRDYCDDTNSILCSSPDKFVDALTSLNNNREKLEQLRKSSHEKAKNYTIDNFKKDLDEILHTV